MRSVYQDRLGTNIGITHKGLPFSQVLQLARAAGDERDGRLHLRAVGREIRLWYGDRCGWRSVLRILRLENRRVAAHEPLVDPAGRQEGGVAGRDRPPVSVHGDADDTVRLRVSGGMDAAGCAAQKRARRGRVA
jgi:hypothetical protein